MVKPRPRVNIINTRDNGRIISMIIKNPYLIIVISRDIKIIRDILNRDEKVTFEGTYYNLPFNGEDATGLGKPLKLIEEPYRKNIPIYLAAIGPKNIELSAEITDGWLPFMYSPSKGDEIFNKYLNVGFDKSQINDKKKNFEALLEGYKNY